MIQRIVLYHWSESASIEAIQNAMNKLPNLQNQVPGIINLSYGEAIAPTVQGYTHGLIIRFKDREALKIYEPHQAHQQIVENLKPLLAEIPLVFDYEC